MEQITSREDLIKEEYIKKTARNYKFHKAAIILSTVIGCGAALYFSLDDNPYEKSQTLSQYRAMQRTLGNLNKGRDIIDVDMPYKPESVNPDLDNLFNNKFERRKTLDNIIGSVERDLQKVKDTKEFRAYEDAKNNQIRNSLYTLAVTLISDIGLAFSCVFGQYRLNRKKDRILKMLG